MRKYEFILENLDCADCASKIEKELNKYEFIKDVFLNFTTLKLKFKCEENDLEKVKKIVDSVEDGLNFLPVDQEIIKTRKISWDLVRVVLAIIVFIPTLFIDNFAWSLALYILSYLVVGYKVLLKSIKNILKGKVFDENFLMSIATIGAFVLQEYVEAIAVMTFYTVGTLLESISVNKSRTSILKMLSSDVKEVNVVKNNSIEIRKIEQIEVGDKILIKPGEKIVVDGVIIEGEGYFDTSLATGESVPRFYQTEDIVYAGYISKNAGVVIEAQKLASESLTARINQLVEVASEKKSKSEQFITKFASIYTPVIFVLAICIAIIPPFFDGDYKNYIYRALMFLIISCPCALVISIPLSFFAGIGRLSKDGILIKGSQYLEIIAKSNAIVMDKTGTLTKGEFAISKIVVYDILESELIKIAAHAEYYSSHPLGNIVLEAYKGEIDVSSIQEFQEISGQGIKLLYQNQQLLVGNYSLLLENEIIVEEVKEVGSIIYVGLGGKLLGYFILKDQIKDDMVEIIKEYKKNGLKQLYILSGDNQSAVKEVAEKLEINNYYYNLAPEQKLIKLEEIIDSSTGKVIYIGDGINDSPSLKRADIGVSMGIKGSDVAIETSDMVILSDDLDKINSASKISKYTLKIVKQNILFAIIIKLIVLGLGAIGLSTMWEAIVADVGVTVLVVFNSLRILKVKTKRPL